MKKEIKKKVTPFGQHILLKPIVNDVKEMDGIFLPDNVKEAAVEFEIVELGYGEFDVKIGDTILLSKYNDGFDFLQDDIHYKIVTQDNILAII